MPAQRKKLPTKTRSRKSRVKKKCAQKNTESSATPASTQANTEIKLANVSLQSVVPFPIWDYRPFQPGAWRNIGGFFASLSVVTRQDELYSNVPEYPLMYEIERGCAIYLTPSKVVPLVCKDCGIAGDSAIQQSMFSPRRDCYVPDHEDELHARAALHHFAGTPLAGNIENPPWDFIMTALLKAGHAAKDIADMTAPDALKNFVAAIQPQSSRTRRPYVTFSPDYRAVFVDGKILDRFPNSAWISTVFKELDAAQKNKNPEDRFIIWEDCLKGTTLQGDRNDPSRIIGRRHPKYKQYLEVEKILIQGQTRHKVALRQGP